jgi:hypothetical protein
MNISKSMLAVVAGGSFTAFLVQPWIISLALCVIWGTVCAIVECEAKGTI